MNKSALTSRLAALLRERARGDRYIVLNSEQACQALGCSPAELNKALLLLQEKGAVLHVEELPADDAVHRN